MKSLVSAMLLSLAIGVGSALAQTSAPAPTGQQPTSAPQMSQDQKKTISKSCSDQATAKGVAWQGTEEIQVRVQKGRWQGAVIIGQRQRLANNKIGARHPALR